MNQINGLEPIQDDEAEQDERARNLGDFDMGDKGKNTLNGESNNVSLSCTFLFLFATLRINDFHRGAD